MKIFQDSVCNQKRLPFFTIVVGEIEIQRTLGNKY